MPWSVGSPPPVFTNTQILTQLGSGFYWPGATITYSFPVTTTLFTGQGEATGFSAFSAAQQAKANVVFALWDDLIAPSITQASANAGKIVLANSSTDDTGVVMNSAGYAYTSSSITGGGLSNAQIWFNSWYNGTTGGAGNNLMNPTIGLHGFSTFIHEIGHALGLEHMGNYNGSGDAPTQASSYQDSTVYTIMSYFGPSWGSTLSKGMGLVAWADWVGADGKLYDPQTPMLNDILAMQNFYGADTTTRTGNTVYGFNSTLAAVNGGIYDFAQNANPILCIYDAGGNDTLDLSGYNTPSNIDLNAGAFSDANSMTKNISIAYTAVIENAVGGGGNDTIVGNAANNILSGNGGQDTLTGGIGNDRLKGGLMNDTLYGNGGRDTAVFDVASSAITRTHNADGTWTISAGADGTDTLRNVEILQLTDRKVVIEDPTSDFNADGTSDLLWFRQSTGTAKIVGLTNNVANGSTTQTTVGSEWTLQTSGDFNGDGSSDFIWKNNTTGEFYIYNYVNNVQTGGKSLGIIGTTWDAVASGDFNADGTGDILWRNSSNGQLYIYNMSNNTVTSTSSLGVIGSSWGMGAVGDFNGDGTSDVMLIRATDGLVYNWNITNGAVSGGFNYGALGTNWGVVGAGDFNADGFDDVVLRNNTNGQLYLWMLDSQNKVASTSNLGVIGTSWVVDAVGDANGDGSSDIFLKNTSTGQFYVWDIVNGANVGGASLGMQGTDWVLV